MKRILLVVFLVVIGVSSSPGQVVNREWRTIDKSDYYGRIPNNTEVERWKHQFELVNPVKSIDELDLAGFKDYNQCVAALDLIGIISNENRFGHSDERTLWRLLQYDPNYDILPRTGFSRIRHISSQISKLVDYEPASNTEHSNQIALRISLERLYLSVLQQEILKRCRAELQNTIREENRIWEQYHKRCLACYETVIGGPESLRGNSWERAFGFYELADYEMVISGCEAFLKELMGEVSEPLATPKWTIVSMEDVKREFDGFSIEQNEYSFSREKQKATLENEKNTWCAWINCRVKVSKNLSSHQKEIYDAETTRLTRFKYVMLKNCLMLDNDYCLPEEKAKLIAIP